MKLVQNYQRGVMKEAATKDGVFSPQKFFTALKKLEPEIRGALFSKEELKKLAQADVYFHSFPKNFNPSGTAHASALQEFFSHPLASTMANTRDVGITAFIKMAGSNPEARAAMELAQSTIKGERNMSKAVKSLFKPAKDTLPLAIMPVASNRDKLIRHLDAYRTDPSKFVAINDNNPIPEYSQSFAATTARVMEFLSMAEPDPKQMGMLDKKFEMTPMQKAQYNRTLDIAQNPLTVLSRIHTQTLTLDDVKAVQAMYPAVYKQIAEKMMHEVVEARAKGTLIPHAMRLQMSMFLGQPLDSSLSQQGIAAAQMTSAPGKESSPQQQGGGGVKHSTAGLAKMAKSASTSSQIREEARSKQ